MLAAEAGFVFNLGVEPEFFVFRPEALDDPTGYLAPVRQEVLDHNIVYEYRYMLVLDSLANIRKEAYKQRPKSAVPDYRFTKDRQHWWLVNAHDTGFPLGNHDDRLILAQ